MAAWAPFGRGELKVPAVVDAGATDAAADLVEAEPREAEPVAPDGPIDRPPATP